MPAIPKNIAEFDDRRKKLYFQSSRRSMKEMDIIFTAFAMAVLAELTEAQLDEYERLLTMPDTDLLAWATGRAPVPNNERFALLDRFIDFAVKGFARPDISHL
ncbi:MAG: succinate dehydrogenase assembly factor 2 [Alphaproteobacteria bacterium]|nr:succinate dehydrogenase assembly factor 2 [Alphaproteobacteria bacterium]